MLTTYSSPETTNLILQTILTIVSQPEGALEMLRIEDLSPLTEIAVQYPLVLDIFSFTWTNASTIGPPDAVRESIDKYVTILLVVFKDTDAVTLLNFIGNLIPKLTPEVSADCSQPWKHQLTCARLFLKARNGCLLL